MSDKDKLDGVEQEPLLDDEDEALLDRIWNTAAVPHKVYNGAETTMPAKSVQKADKKPPAKKKS